MKINNPNKKYYQIQKDKYIKGFVEKYQRLMIDNLPEFLKEYPLTINSTFREK